jgi:hypothetical protein
VAMAALRDPQVRCQALRAMGQGFAARLALPWLERFGDPGSPPCDVRWMAPGVSRCADPAVVEAALLAIPTAIRDVPGSGDPERRLRRVSTPAQ